MKNTRDVLNSPRLNEIKRKKGVASRKKILIISISILVVVISLGLLSGWKKININNVAVSGNRVIETKLIEDLIEENLAGKYLWIFSKRNFLLYPKNKITDDLYLNFKRLKDITLNIKDATTLEIILSERKATYTWCGEDFPAQGVKLEDAKCYFMDDLGYVFDEAPYFSGEVYFRFFGKTESTTLYPTGSSFVKGKFENYVSFLDTLIDMKFNPSALLVKEDGDVEIYLSSSETLQNAPKIIFKNSADLIKLTENLRAAVDTEPLKTDLIKKYSSLLYIDLRFTNKVYYKFSNGEGSI